MTMKQRVQQWQQDKVCTFDMEQHRDSVPEKVSGAIDEVLEKNELTTRVNIAIDGVCGGGKTTLAGALAARYDCNLFHMDDFFLRMEQRTLERYAQAGGNVDYERFKEEVLDHLADEGGFTYRPFDCVTMGLGESRTVPYKRLNIIEGAYSCHPYFGDIYQVRFFVDLSPEEQRARILARNGEEKYKRFVNEWIPMENKYFETYKIGDQCIRISLK